MLYKSQNIEATLLTEIQRQSVHQSRILLAVVGAPASGKSTFSERLKTLLGERACVVPMDGFHLDNQSLINQNLLHRKGAPNTFNVWAFLELIKTVKQAQGEVSYPTFDRQQDVVVSDGGIIPTSAQYIIVEGNYLLLQSGGWSDLSPLWDMSIYLDVPQSILRKRLIKRWLYYGLSYDDAVKRTEENDLKNAVTVIKQSASADYSISDIN